MTAEDAAGSRENGRVLAADALKQALGTVLDYASKGGYIVTWDAAAEAILDALPEGWELRMAERAKAAEADAERLAAALDRILNEYVKPGYEVGIGATGQGYRALAAHEARVSAHAVGHQDREDARE